jgi:hypothetical protein
VAPMLCVNLGCNTWTATGVDTGFSPGEPKPFLISLHFCELCLFPLYKVPGYGEIRFEKRLIARIQTIIAQFIFR